MTAKTWRKKIVEAMQEVGTYRESFAGAIDTLAGILERRDKAQETFEASGGSVLVKHTNKGGATNIEQNPALVLINNLNRDALAYWRDLGLTPAGLKKIDDSAMKPKKKSALAEALKALEG